MDEQRARQRHEDIAKQIEREDGLIGARMTWLLASEALLFGGVGLLATKAAEKEVKCGAVVLLLLGSFGLLCLSTVVAVLCRDATRAAHAQLMYLRDCWRERVPNGHYVPPFGDLAAHNDGINYPVTLASCLAWFSWIGAGAFALIAIWQFHFPCTCRTSFLFFLALVFFAVVCGFIMEGKPKDSAHKPSELLPTREMRSIAVQLPPVVSVPQHLDRLRLDPDPYGLDALQAERAAVRRL